MCVEDVHLMIEESNQDYWSEVGSRNLSAWAIRQKSTGAFLPARKNGRGYSFDEPVFGCFPRLFQSKMSAVRALSAWLQGQWKNEWHTKGGSPWSLDPPEDYQAASPEKVDGRDPHDMEIVEFILFEVAK